jgi:glycosyltransferase involved in cell wall biosynthesis
MTRALRVLHIASGDLWAGAEVQAFTLLSHLARIPNTEVAMVVMNEGTLVHKLRSAGVPVYVLDEARVASPCIFKRLCAILRAWRPDVIHTHREKENILGSMANRLCWNVPSVRTVHGGREDSRVAGWKGARRRAVRALDRWCGRALQQRVIAVTRELAARLTGEFPAEKIVVIENGVDTAAVRAESGIAEFRAARPDVTHIGIVGRLTEVKRVDLFLEAAAALLRDFPQRAWAFHVFGDGPERSRLQGVCERLQISDRVTFHGHRQDIAICIAGLDALVICSDHEGLPMTALEAAALAVPTVAHAVGGLVEVVPQEFLVARHEADGYRDGILRALHADGRVIAEKHANATLPRFSAHRNAERIHALYEEVTAARNARQPDEGLAGDNDGESR